MLSCDLWPSHDPWEEPDLQHAIPLPLPRLDKMLAVMTDGVKPFLTISAKRPQPGWPSLQVSNVWCIYVINRVLICNSAPPYGEDESVGGTCGPQDPVPCLLSSRLPWRSLLQDKLQTLKLDCLTSPNTALTANSKIQGPTVYRSMSQPLPSISVLYTSSSHCNECSFISWNMHSASVKVAALAVSIDSNCQLLSVKHPNEERMLMNIVGPNPPSDPHAPHKFGQGGLQQITILTVAFQYCWITSARHGNASWLS